MAIFKAYVHIPLVNLGETLSTYKQRTVQYLQKLLFDVYDGEAHELNYCSAYPQNLRNEKIFMKHHIRYGWNMPLDIQEADEQGELIQHSISSDLEFLLPQPYSFEPIEDTPDYTGHELGIYERPDFIHWGISALDGEHLDTYLIKYYQHHDPSITSQLLNGILLATPRKRKEMRDPARLLNHKLAKTIFALDQLLCSKSVPHSIEYKLGDHIIVPPSQIPPSPSFPSPQEQLPSEDSGPSADDLWNLFSL